MLLRIGSNVLLLHITVQAVNKSYFVTTETCTCTTLVDAVCHLKYFVSSFITSFKTDIHVLDKNMALSNSDSN